MLQTARALRREAEGLQSASPRIGGANTLVKCPAPWYTQNVHSVDGARPEQPSAYP